MTKDEQKKEAYRQGETDARAGILLSEGSRRFKNNSELLAAYTEGYVVGLRSKR